MLSKAIKEDINTLISLARASNIDGKATHMTEFERLGSFLKQEPDDVGVLVVGCPMHGCHPSVFRVMHHIGTMVNQTSHNLQS